MTTVVDTLDDLRPLIGTNLGFSSWFPIDQKRVDMFADATDDHQWIHVDPERAAAGPFGGTIAHGYLTLALFIPMWTEILTVRSVNRKVNYGLGKVRFPAPVSTGSRLRASATLAAFEDVQGGAQLTVDAVVERDGGDKPVCVAEAIFRYYT